MNVAPNPNPEQNEPGKEEVNQAAHDQGPPSDAGPKSVEEFEQAHRNRLRGYFSSMMKGVAFGVGKAIGENLPDGFDDFWDILNS